MTKKICKHKWVHLTEVNKNLRHEKCLWIFHRCKLCGMESEGDRLYNKKGEPL